MLPASDCGLSPLGQTQAGRGCEAADKTSTGKFSATPRSQHARRNACIYVRVSDSFYHCRKIQEVYPQIGGAVLLHTGCIGGSGGGEGLRNVCIHRRGGGHGSRVTKQSTRSTHVPLFQAAKPYSSENPHCRKARRSTFEPDLCVPATVKTGGTKSAVAAQTMELGAFQLVGI